MPTLHERIDEWLAPKLEELDAYLVEVRHNPASRRIEVYLDRDAPGKGIDLDACEAVSRFLETYLDHADGVPRDYILEVSSPGMTNPFKVLRQYRKYIGREVDVVLLDGRKLQGILADASEEGIELDAYVGGSAKPKSKPKPGAAPVEPETERHSLPFSTIKSTKRSLPF
jgi:ribosome maturation factor RimP